VHIRELLTLSTALAVSALLTGCGGGENSEDDGDAGGRGQQLYVATTDGADPTLVETGASLQQLTWSPESERFAFFNENPTGGPGDLHIVDPANPKDDVVVPVPGQPHRIAFSPSGERIGVVYFANGGPIIGLTTPDGSDLKTVAELPAAQGFDSLIWLDEDSVLVEEPVDSQPRFVSYDVNSGERFQYDARSGFLGPVLSPDGKRIAWSEYCSRDTGTPGVWTFEFEHQNLQWVDHVCGHLTGLAWSPDGTEIAYTAWYTTDDDATDVDPQTTGGLFVVNLASGGVRKIADPEEGTFDEYGSDGAVDVGVEWLPNGAGFRLYRDHAYNCDDCGDARELILMNPDGSDENPVVAGDIEAVGEELIAHTTEDGFTISSIEGDEDDLVLEHDDEWRFRAADFSPDGEWIAFTRFHCGDCVFP
jgi:Tol biopolymer transport system component